MVMVRAPGRGFPQSTDFWVAGVGKDLSAEARNRLWYKALSTLGQIGRLDWREDFAFLDRPAYGATGMDQYLGWLCAWRNGVLGEVIHPIIDAGMDYLSRERPQDLPISVVWGDSNPGNKPVHDAPTVRSRRDFEAHPPGTDEKNIGGGVVF